MDFSPSAQPGFPNGWNRPPEVRGCVSTVGVVLDHSVFWRIQDGMFRDDSVDRDEIGAENGLSVGIVQMADELGKMLALFGDDGQDLGVPETLLKNVVSACPGPSSSCPPCLRSTRIRLQAPQDQRGGGQVGNRGIGRQDSSARIDAKILPP